MGAHVMIARVEVTHCTGCGREFDVQIAYHRQGMCHTCSSRRYNPQPLRRFVPLETVLDEYRFMRDAGVPLAEMPARLGMSFRAFSKALYRGRKAGDPRVADFRGMGAAA